jgi:hypothetical protein
LFGAAGGPSILSRLRVMSTSPSPANILVGRKVRLRRLVWTKTLRIGEGERARVLCVDPDEGTLTLEGIREGKLQLGDRRIVRRVRIADVEVLR